MSLIKSSLYLFTFVFAIITQSAQASFIPEAQLIENDMYLEEDDNDYYKYAGTGKIKLLEEQDQASAFNFSYLYYEPKNDIKNRLIVVTPNIRGLTLVEKRMAHKLSKRGYHVIIPMTQILFETIDDNTFHAMENLHYYCLSLTVKLIDHFHARDDFDRERVGLVGASLGGIRSSMLMGSDHRFRAMFISVAGSDLPKIYSQSQHEILIDIRRRHMNFLGINQESEYEQVLRENLSLDPSILTQSPYLDNIAMIIANDDKIVPAVNQWKLWNSITETGHRPKTYEKDCTHVVGALWLVRYENRVVDWMNERL